MAAVTEAPSAVVESIQFSFYTYEEVRKLSVKEITNPDAIDSKNMPIPDGPYDAALGPVKDTDSCKTCGQLAIRCPGHCGHIELARPIFNPLLCSTLKNILTITCFFCHRFRFKDELINKYIVMLKHIAQGNIVAAKEAEVSFVDSIIDEDEDNMDVDGKVFNHELLSIYAPGERKPWTSLQYSEAVHVLSNIMRFSSKKCTHCNRANPKIASSQDGWFTKTILEKDITSNSLRGDPIADENDEAMDDKIKSEVKHMSSGLKALSSTFFRNMYASAGESHLLPTEVELILQKLWKNDAKLCNLICDIQQNTSSGDKNEKAYSVFLLKDLLVPPSKFRPLGFVGGEVIQHPQNLLLSKVLASNSTLRELISTDPYNPKNIQIWMELQKNVSMFYDSSKSIGKRDKENPGIRQMIERKGGILRQKMMGKRVNYACRSVISPDPYLAVNEIGIPPYFAVRLTYPEKVTPWNVDKLRHAIMNGANTHPGATHYMDKDRPYRLNIKSMCKSISRKLPTSRLVSNENGKGPEYDFEGKVVYRHLQDGDIVLVNRQPTLHKSSMMAHVVRILKGEKTLRMHYANCSTYNADFDGDEMNVHFPQDDISRSEALNIVNANKQYIVTTSGDPIRGLIQDHIISAVLLSKKDTFLTREEYHQLLYASWVPPAVSSIQVSKMGLKVSTLNTNNEIQPLPPAIWKPKPLWTGKQVITAILCHITRGRSPFTVEKEGKIPKEYFANEKTEYVMHIYNNELIHGIIDKAQFGKYGLVHIVHELYGADTAGTLLSVFSRLFTTYLQMHAFTCGVDDLLLKPESDMERETLLAKTEAQSEDVHHRFTGTKNGEIDSLGLRSEIEKIIRSKGESGTARLDRMMSNTLNGITSEVNKRLFPTGLQKPFPKNCLSLMTTTGAKGGLVNLTQISSLLGQQELEGKRVPRMVSGKTLPCFPPWDTSGRAGGFIGDRFLTGLRPQEYYFHCMAGRDGLVDTAVKTSRSGYLQRCIIKSLEGLKVCYDYTVRDADGSVIQFKYGEDGLDVLKTSYVSNLVALSTNHKVVLESLGSQLEDAHLSKSNSFIKELPNSLKKEVTRVASMPSDNKNVHSNSKFKRKDLLKLMKLKYLSSLAEPGETVGILAAQSVGEPSTQMTLNTFHLAGRGEMNVTLGIPRLQELLKTASKVISTPIMTCPLLPNKTREDGEKLAGKLRKIRVVDIVESMSVTTVPFYIYGNQASTLYKLKMKLFKPALYPPHTELSLDDCMSLLRTTFVDAVEDNISKHLELISKISNIEFVASREDDVAEMADEEDETDGKKGGGDNDEDEEQDQENNDGGADAEKRIKQKCDEIEYDDEDDNKASAVADEFANQSQPGFESEVEQAGSENDDYEIGKKDTDAISDEDSEDDNGIIANEEKMDDTVSSSAKKKTKSKGTGKTSGKSESKSKSRAKRKSTSRKKIKSLIYVDTKGLNFEAHFVLSNQQHILLAEIAQKTAKSIYICQSGNIDRCSVVNIKQQNRNSADALQTAGVHFLTFWEMQDILNINSITTNDIHAMLTTYGVEAARATIINEVQGVFGSYGISVNPRHLSLIADYMTAHGGYRPMERTGMSHSNTSPFSKMTFETATKFIVAAALHGERDLIETPSASVCLGQPVKFGTGCFDLFQEV